MALQKIVPGVISMRLSQKVIFRCEEECHSTLTTWSVMLRYAIIHNLGIIQSSDNETFYNVYREIDNSYIGYIEIRR